MTAAGLHCRLLLGWKPDHATLVSGAKVLSEEALPASGKEDVYYWHHATAVLRHVNDSSWKKWNEAMNTTLTKLQESQGKEKGSWPSSGDYWGQNSGRLYTTCFSIWCLQSYYQNQFTLDADPGK